MYSNAEQLKYDNAVTAEIKVPINYNGDRAVQLFTGREAPRNAHQFQLLKEFMSPRENG